MKLTISGLDTLRDRLKGATKAARPRWQREGRDMRRIARQLTPVRTGAARRGWRYRVPKRGGLHLTNGVPYIDHVHPAGDEQQVIDKIREAAEQRKPVLIEDLSRLVSDTINR